MIIKELYCPIANFLLILSMVLGCSSPEDPETTTYHEEMIGFVIDSQDGQEIFRSDLYPTSVFTLNGLQVKYQFDSILSFLDNKATISGPKNIYGFNNIYDAYLKIEVKYYGKINKIIGNQTELYFPVEIRLNRYAYFLKLYNDAYEYHGWRFWGYSADNNSLTNFGTFSSRSGQSLSAWFEEARPVLNLGYYYIQKNNIDIIPKGDYMNFSNFNKYIVFAETSSGGRQFVNSEWRIPTSTDIFHRLITIVGPIDTLIDTLSTNPLTADTTLLQQNDMVIPYKVQF